MNKVFLLGEVSRKPSLSSTSDGTPVLNLDVKTIQTWHDQYGKMQSRREFHTVVVWGKNAEPYSQKIEKGMMICIDGELTTRSYEKDGLRLYRTDIKANNLDVWQPTKHLLNE